MAIPLTDEEITQLRALLNNTSPLKDQTPLNASEFTTAILGAVHDNTEQGRLRKLGFAIAHQALQAVNPLRLTFEEVTLFENSTGSLTHNITTPYNLDIKSGLTRHNFNDDYFGFTFVFYESTQSKTNPDRLGPHKQDFIWKNKWFETQTDTTKSVAWSATHGTSHFWKSSDTSFFATNNSTGLNPEIKRIIGHKITLELETPA